MIDVGAGIPAARISEWIITNKYMSRKERQTRDVRRYGIATVAAVATVATVGS